MRYVIRAMILVALPLGALAQDRGPALDRIPIQMDAGAFDGPGAWPLGVGVPLPRGKMKSGEGLRLRGDKQGLVPIQVTEKTKWRDGSIQWTWVDFQGDPRDRYVLEMGGGAVGFKASARAAAPEPRVKVSQDDVTLTIETGSISVIWDKNLASPTKIFIGKSHVIEGDGRGTYAVDNRGRRGVMGGKDAELSWTVETAGPIRAVVRVEGWYVTPEGERLARAVVRYHLYAGRTFFTMDHTFIFTEDTDQVWFKEVAVRFPWQGKESARARFGVKEAPEIATEIGGEKDEAWIFQDDYPHFAQQRTHFSSGKNDKPLQEGAVAAGWCEASDGTSGITVAVQDLARQFPKELSTDRRGVTARLWSNRGGKELDYRPNTLVDDYYGNDWIGAMKKGPVNGEMVPCDAEGFRKLNPSALGSARTHFLLCAYHAEPPDSKTTPRLAAAFERPPAALADPSWLCASGALRRVAPKDEKRFPEVEQFISEFFDIWISRMKDFPMNGWIGSGVGPELAYEKREDGKTYASFYRLNNIAPYHTPKNVWVGYYRSGDRKFLDFAEPYTRFLSDFTVLHWSGGREKKEAGLIVTGMGPFPLYWAGPGYWETRGASTDYLVPLRLAYFLRDCRWARDGLELYADAMNRDWDLDKCRTFNAPFTHLSMMLNAYLVTQDPRLEKKLHTLADALVDLNDPLGLSIAFYKRKLEFPYDATYKYERKILALLDYADTFGVEGEQPAVRKAKKAVIKANEELFATASQCCPVAYQNYMPVHLVRCFGWTGNPDYRAVAAGHVQSALDWFQEFKATPPEKQYLGPFTPDKQGFPFFTVPHVLALLSDPEYVKQTFPYLANLGRDRECPIYIMKEKGREAYVLVSVITCLAEPKGDAPAGADLRLLQPEVSVRVVGPNGKGLEGCVKEQTMHHANVYRVTLPAAAAPGAYRVSFGCNRFLVIGSNVDKLVLHMPEGTYLGHRDTLGYPLTRNKPYYFQAPQGRKSFTVRVSHPIRLFDPSGKEQEEAKEKRGRITIAGGKSGLWSFIPGAAGYVQFEDVLPVVSFGEASRFFIPPEVKKANVETEWQPPKQEGLVEGRFGQGLHISGKSYKAQWGKLASGFPFPEGTVEFFYRPDWSSRWLPEREPSPFWTAPPLYFGYRHQPQREGINSFYTWMQFHPVWEKGEVGWLTRVEAYASFDAGEWNHLACTWQFEPPKCVIYRNGKNVGELPDPYRYNRGALVIPKRQGDGTLTLSPWPGTYDEFRMSRSVRYTKDFTPPKERLDEDRETVLLFHFDQGLRGTGRASAVEFVRE